MTQNNFTVCPYLGMSGERTVVRTEPDLMHRCFAQSPAGQPDLDHQARYCLSANYPACSIYKQYVEPETEELEEDEEETRQGMSSAARLALLLIPIALLLTLALLYFRDLASAPTPVAIEVAQPTQASPIPTQPPVATTDSSQPQPIAAVTLVRPETVTPAPGGQVFSATPLQGEVGWWTSSEADSNHVSDSYLYAGYYEGNSFLSAVRFDLKGAPRGAPISDGTIQLTGLLDDRFNPGSGGTWSVQLIPGKALPPLQQVNFQTLLNTPAQMTLFPELYPADLGVGQVNIVNLDASARSWLQEQILLGETEIIARITGPGGGDSLFAWDSGDGPATAGEAPRLILSLDAPPPTAPPLPTDVFLVATLTPTPENVLTAAAEIALSTQQALDGASGSQIIPVYTPTLVPENLATVQAGRLLAGLPLYVVYTPVPANGATATANALEATAIAVTTGTFTPVPPDAVTPIIVLPTPMPENVATAAAQKAITTAQAASVGTVTPLPPNIVMATRTPTAIVVTRTLTPENQQTAAINSLIMTAVAATTGTFTPFPPNVVTATPSPLPTATPKAPFLIYLDQITPDPTATGDGRMPQELRGKVLFKSDREDGTRIMAVDPATGRQANLASPWPYSEAEHIQLTSPDGRFVLTVEYDDIGRTQIISTDVSTGARQKITNNRLGAYEPAWSPTANRIAFGSWDSGNEDIYTMDPDGSNVIQITTNGSQDRYPSWSPNGSQIVYWSSRDTGRRQLWVMNADGSNPRRMLTSNYNDYNPIWVR